MLMGKPIRLLAYACVVCGTASPAFAKEKPDPAHVKAAKKACITGDVSKGIDILGDLYVETNDITYVFNEGRCYQQNHRWEEALDRFEEYVRKSPNLEPSARAEVEGYIADCKSHIPSAPSTGPAQPAPAAPPPPPEEPTEGVPALSHAGAVVSPSAVGTGAGLRITGIVVGAVGVAAIATGVVLDLETHSIVSDINHNGYDAGKVSSRDSYETWGWVSFGVGAAALVAGTTLYLVGASAARSEGPALSLVPVASKNGAMLLVHGGIQ